MASNKKWIVAGSITLLIVFGVSMGTGAIIGATTKDDPSYIKMSVGNTEVKLDELELGTKDSSDAEKASILEEYFYEKSIEELAKENNDWNRPHSLLNINEDELKNSFVKVKFINDTQTSSVFEYLNSMVETSNKPGDIIKLIAELKGVVGTTGTYNYLEITGLQLLQDSTYSDLVESIYKTLSEDVSYLKEVYKEMYSYFYLWQSPVQSKTYDTILTRELVYSSPSLVSEMDMDASELWGLGLNPTDPNYKYYDNLTSVDSSNLQVESSAWNEMFDAFTTSNVITDQTTQDDQLVLDSTAGLVEGFKGFKGIQFGTSAGSLVGDDWTDWDNTWNTEDAGQTSVATYSNEDVLTNANYYVSTEKYAPGEGAIIKSDSDSSGGEESPDEGTAYTYAYSQLYPFKFVDNGKNTYSLFANGDSSAYKVADDSATADNYIFDLWFGDYSLAGEIYTVESILKHKDSLINASMNYWKDHGFYIELSGSYEEDLASFLPTEILLDN